MIPIYEDQDNFKCIDLLNQVHDSILFQISLSYNWVQHAEALIKLIELMLTPLIWHGSSFILPVDLKVGTNLGKEIGVKYAQNAETMAVRLREIYEECIRAREEVPLGSILQDSESDDGELLGVDGAS